MPKAPIIIATPGFAHDVDATKQELLSFAVDDWFRLDEALEIAHRVFTASRKVEIEKTAKALAEMLHEGLIKLAWVDFTNDAEEGLDAAAAIAALHNDANWARTNNPRALCFAATDEGTLAYRSHPSS